MSVVRNISLKRSPSSLSSYSGRSRGGNNASEHQRIITSGGHNGSSNGFGGLDNGDLMNIQLTAATSGVVPDDTFTVSQAVNALGFGRFQIILSFLTGLCWMADSMEVMILSILSPALQCEWGIGQYSQVRTALDNDLHSN